MNNNLLFKILSSLPVILIALYFIPFLGVCLILLRYFMYDNKERILTPIYIIGVGIIVLIPKVLYFIFNIVKVDIETIPYLNNVIISDLYNVDFINYSKRLICTGVIFLIISYVLKTIFDKLGSKLNSVISEAQIKNAEISRENDMKMKIKREKAKNTSYVKCPSCGSDNLLGKKFGTCMYCRRKIENKNYKE